MLHHLGLVGPSQAQHVLPVPRARRHPAIDPRSLHVTVLLPPSTVKDDVVYFA